MSKGADAVIDFLRRLEQKCQKLWCRIMAMNHLRRTVMLAVNEVSDNECSHLTLFAHLAMSDNTQTAWVSRPVGGIPVSADLAPSIVFAVLYALLLPNIIYNFFFRKPRAWNAIQIGTLLFAVERIAWCIIRAVQASHPANRASGGQMNYIQATVGLGFIGVSQSIVMYMVNTQLNGTCYLDIQ
ncbi:hypothetical protein AG1IA_03915 [Rhizoctonia solani AG-1 IA]|uniref:Uncharacterized protein n=1 Tax=Thanatephorus cucumeris (strain AG1-IA) TaxID=983506 RepID=L8X0A4_THACA|nr:hypothetical protein AG1IA_03915 [Rhizoctonia solani AG-1 IA]